jgi:hypothetical protein
MQTSRQTRSLVILTICLVGILTLLFLPSLNSNNVLFSNDGPLGAVKASADQPAGFKGLWHDLNSIGNNVGSLYVSFSSALLYILGPYLFSKFYVPIVLLILGFSAWYCFKLLKLAPLACILGGLAAVLNSTYFSVACWGVGPQAITAGMSFLAIALIINASREPSCRWLKLMLAGFAVGMGVMEGFDVGAIYSLVVAAFAFFYSLSGEGTLPSRIGKGIGRVAVIAACAGLLATQAVSGLISTQIKGISGTDQDSKSKQERWDWATQWSLPKRESLSLLVPGLFGYRMDTPKDMVAFQNAYEGGIYWGAVGRDPAWDRYYANGKQGQRPGGFQRFAGGGNYPGLLVVIIGIWAATQAFRKKGSCYSRGDAWPLKFFSIAIVISLLLAYGRFAPVYQILYALPYFSTIRNPAKFLHIVTFGLLFLFAFGVDALGRRYLVVATEKVDRAKTWWARATTFEKRWVLGCLASVAVSLLGWLIYSSSRAAIEQYMTEVEIPASMASLVAGFSISQVGIYVLFLVLSVGLFIAILSGRFTGKNATFGAILIGALLVVDLGRANFPWIIYWNYKQKYATNPVIDFLREKPYENRVALVPGWIPLVFRLPEELSRAESNFDQLYHIEWAQHHFQYYNVQSLDIVQMPRMPSDLEAFEKKLQFRGTPDTLPLVTRRWQLTNTRYLVGAADMLQLLDQGIDSSQHRFRIVMRFDLAPKPGITNPTGYDQVTAVPSTNGAFALFGFSGALPRTKLYSTWQVNTNDQDTLNQLAASSFDPTQKVLVSTPISNSGASSTNQVPATVDFVSYAPKHIVMKAHATAASVLLLNDKYDPAWKVFVDGKQQTLLRCNYIMRGVEVPAGDHQIEWRFEPGIAGLCVSLAAILAALLVIIFLALPFNSGAPEAPVKRA